MILLNIPTISASERLFLMYRLLPECICKNRYAVLTEGMSVRESARLHSIVSLKS